MSFSTEAQCYKPISTKGRSMRKIRRNKKFSEFEIIGISTNRVLKLGSSRLQLYEEDRCFLQHELYASRTNNNPHKFLSP